MRKRGRAVAGVAGFALTSALLVLPTAPLAWADDPVADCLAADNIYVYVFNQGTELVQGCTQGATGMARLTELTTVQTTSSFICQIAGQPEICTMPTGDEPYWTYFWWRDGAWKYATIGASYPGEPGSIEAWHFSAGLEPPIVPDATAPATATAQPTQQPSTDSQTPPAGDEPEQDATATAWLPTAITAGVLGIAAISYGLFRSRRRPR